MIRDMSTNLWPYLETIAFPRTMPSLWVFSSIHSARVTLEEKTREDVTLVFSSLEDCPMQERTDLTHKIPGTELRTSE